MVETKGSVNAGLLVFMKTIIAAITITASSVFGQQIQQIPYEVFQQMNQEQQRNIMLLQQSINNQAELERQAEELEDLQNQQREILDNQESILEHFKQ